MFSKVRACLEICGYSQVFNSIHLNQLVSGIKKETINFYRLLKWRVGELYLSLKSRFNMISGWFVIVDSPNHSPILFLL